MSEKTVSMEDVASIAADVVDRKLGAMQRRVLDACEALNEHARLDLARRESCTAAEARRIREHNIVRRSDVLVELTCAFLVSGHVPTGALENARLMVDGFTDAELGLLPEPDEKGGAT